MSHRSVLQEEQRWKLESLRFIHAVYPIIFKFDSSSCKFLIQHRFYCWFIVIQYEIKQLYNAEC